MARHAGARSALLAAAVALLRASAVRDSARLHADAGQDADNDPPDPTTTHAGDGDKMPDLTTTHAADPGRCCCKGPWPELCYQLPPEHLARKGADKVCPKEKAYLPHDVWGFADLPVNCKDPSYQRLPVGGPKVKVVAYFLRHGMSCSNAFANQGAWEERGMFKTPALKALLAPRNSLDYLDPPLTNLAMERAKILGAIIQLEILKRTNGVRPLLLSSAMVRALETALYNFPGWPAHPIPYVAEVGPSPENRVSPYEEQKAKLTRQPSTEKVLENLEFDAMLETDARRSESSYDAFRHLLPGVLHQLWSDAQPRPDAEIPVVIVSHSVFMNSSLQCGGPTESHIPMNNEVWVQYYEFQWGAWDAFLEEKGCERLLDREFFPPVSPNLCPSDVARCTDHDNDFMPIAWLEARKSKSNCDGPLGLSIVNRDEKKERKYMQRFKELVAEGRLRRDPDGIVHVERKSHPELGVQGAGSMGSSPEQ